MIRKILIIMLIAGATGCTMIPRYARPVPPIPGEWPDGPAYKGPGAGATGRAAADIGWREFYGDERLREVIDLAIANNRDLRIAALNIEKARALYRIQRADLFPAIDASGAVVRQRVPAGTSPAGEATTATLYQANVGTTSWELDFFGRIRSLNESALQQFFATEQARRSLFIALCSEVANAYLLRAADSEALRYTRSTLAAREHTYRMMQRRFELGVSSGVDVSQARTLLESARADVAAYTRLVALDENALNLLVGAQVSPELLADELGRITPPGEVAAGLSADVLLSRPDVLQAENILASFNADIGAARAAFFPRIALTGNVGTISADLTGLFRAGSASWLFSPQISVPIFDGGARKANLGATVAERDIALARYEKTIQIAFREAADALAQRGTLGDQMAAQRSLVEAASDTYRLSNARYEKGIDSYLAVLDAQRSLYTAQQGLIRLHLARLNNLVTLYKVMGGGVTP